MGDFDEAPPTPRVVVVVKVNEAFEWEPVFGGGVFVMFTSTRRG